MPLGSRFIKSNNINVSITINRNSGRDARLEDDNYDDIVESVNDVVRELEDNPEYLGATIVADFSDFMLAPSQWQRLQAWCVNIHECSLLFATHNLLVLCTSNGRSIIIHLIGAGGGLMGPLTGGVGGGGHKKDDNDGDNNKSFGSDSSGGDMFGGSLTQECAF